MKTLAHIIADDAKIITHTVDLSPLAGKTLVLTGASGLVGTYLLATLREASAQGIKTHIFASAAHGFPEYIKEFARDVTWVTGDITDPKILAKLPSADYIVHAAGYGQPGRFLEEPLKTIELNTSVTLALGRKLKEGGSFLFISTSEVYSGLAHPPFSETDIGTTSPMHRRACYIEGKRAGEAIVNAFRAQGVRAASGRLSLAYGPGTKRGDKRVLNAFIEKALAGRLTLLDTGAAQRTYCYVRDAVEIIFHILIKGTEPVYNVGGTSRVTVAELANMVGKKLGVPVVFPKNAGTDATAAGAPDDVRLNMSKTEKEFGKTDYVPLEEGLARTIEWQKMLYEQKHD